MSVVVIVSGGMDSVTLLHYVVKMIGDASEVHVISFNYGQRHVREIKRAQWNCKELNITHHQIVDLRGVSSLLQGSALTSSNVDVPEGNYADENMKSTYVPNRNMILLSLAIGYAVSIKADTIYYGAHAGDHAIYPDCRPEFIKALNDVAKIANYKPIAIKAPFITMDKGDIAILGLKLGVHFEWTWTCYKGEDYPCGKCGACVERAEAFKKAGVPDPLLWKDEQSLLDLH